MQLDVTEEQLQILEDLVTDKVGSLGTEIRHCDNPDYRRALVQKREHLRDLSARLRDLSPTSASGV